jgi:hypothetical protein
MRKSRRRLHAGLRSFVRRMINALRQSAFVSGATPSNSRVHYKFAQSDAIELYMYSGYTKIIDLGVR